MGVGVNIWCVWFLQCYLSGENGYMNIIRPIDHLCALAFKVLGLFCIIHLVTIHYHKDHSHHNAGCYSFICNSFTLKKRKVNISHIKKLLIYNQD